MGLGATGRAEQDEEEYGFEVHGGFCESRASGRSEWACKTPPAQGTSNGGYYFPFNHASVNDDNAVVVVDGAIVIDDDAIVVVDNGNVIDYNGIVIDDGGDVAVDNGIVVGDNGDVVDYNGSVSVDGGRVGFTGSGNWYVSGQGGLAHGRCKRLTPASALQTRTSGVLQFSKLRRSENGKRRDVGTDYAERGGAKHLYVLISFLNDPLG